MAQRHGTMLFTVAPAAAATTSPYGPMPAQNPRNGLRIALEATDELSAEP